MTIFRNPQQKLTDDQVRDILSSPKTSSQLARELDVSVQLVSLIRLGKQWKHIPRPEVSEEIKNQRKISAYLSQSVRNRGSSNKIAVFDEEKIRNIKKRLIAGHKTIDIARDYEVSPGAINCIKRGDNWSQVVVDGFGAVQFRRQRRLTRDEVIEIKKRLAEGAEFGLATRLARKYGVSRKCIYSIRVGENWAHLEP